MLGSMVLRASRIVATWSILTFSFAVKLVMMLALKNKDIGFSGFVNDPMLLRKPSRPVPSQIAL